ncbi:hypothetical protein MHU86_4490 [Fragilaria crotonensis]|nr:hypothetical protein MHU86_4490 [Fragilaria crotonensis]
MCTVTLIMADCALGGGTIKRCKLNSRGVKLAEAESMRDETIAIESVTALRTGNSEPTINEMIEVRAPPNAGASKTKCLQCFTIQMRCVGTNHSVAPVAATVAVPEEWIPMAWVIQH